MDLSFGEEVLAGDTRWRSAPMATVQLVTGPIFDLYSLSSCDVESSFRLVDVKAHFSFRTVTFGFRLKVGMANSSGALLVLTAVQNLTTQFHPSASRSGVFQTGGDTSIQGMHRKMRSVVHVPQSYHIEINAMVQYWSLDSACHLRGIKLSSRGV
ncbi:hypothetical protein HID58_091860 [Brassica napus]|uniref:Uncharacterized protein n=1 Tax=Brassica napus TaxID=3708 RepID=A0ABQ7X0J4_BRANA|nr:hypothetical protein HID58_091860 [Brassica napus]